MSRVTWGSWIFAGVENWPDLKLRRLGKILRNTLL